MVEAYDAAESVHQYHIYFCICHIYYMCKIITSFRVFSVIKGHLSNQFFKQHHTTTNQIMPQKFLFFVRKVSISIMKMTVQKMTGCKQDRQNVEL